MKPVFFATPAAFRTWLRSNHRKKTELLVGFWKTQSAKQSMTWPESVDEALCVGWIDGIRRTRDAQSYTIRFTPRKARGIWSAVNVRNVARLTKEGRLKPAGLAAFEARAAERTGIYSFENRASAKLLPAEQSRFRASKEAWTFFGGAAPSYRRAACWWVISAKKPQTRERRLARLIEDSSNGRTIKELTPPSRRAKG